MLQEFGSAAYWLETSHRSPKPAVRGHQEFDVGIIGGGFTGLWTAYHLLQAEPGLKVAVIEREIIGFGASGRNGGFAMTLLDMGLDQLLKNFGAQRASAAHRAVAASVTEIGETTAAEGIDCELRHGGLMVVATNRGQLERVERDLAAAQTMGLDGFERMTADEAQTQVHSPTYVGAMFEADCAVLHPAKLAHGLAELVERMGATIYEGTDVTAMTEAPAPRSTASTKVRIDTPGGSVTVDQVVLATNAWAAQTEWFKRKVVPLYTYVIMTEPLSEEQWDSIGWESHCGIEDKRNFVHYYRRTLDGRILWGGNDGVIHYKGRIAPRHDRNDGVMNGLESSFRRTFPQLSNIRFTHHWGGPVGITINFIPMFGTLLDGRLHYGLGYNGHGVAPSHTGGKILRDKVLGVRSDLTDLCFVDSTEPAFPPEPLCWISAELTRRSLLRQDSNFDAGRGSGEMDPLLLRVMRRLG
ncbi:MAG: FAD-dependent oxidoreductase [Microthrixaceae bacterium]|nr:FAD-dependent oxidoreductase [Microthrixaceae bacterium]